MMSSGDERSCREARGVKRHGDNSMIGMGVAGSSVADSDSSTSQKKRRSTIHTTNSDKIHIQVYVRSDLWPKIKFILNESVLEYSQDKNSICRQCLKWVHQVGKGEYEFWHRWKGTVDQEIRDRRNHCQNAMKKEYMSE